MNVSERIIPNISHLLRRRSLWLCCLLVLIWVIVSLVTYHAWIRGADHRDFYPRWAGVRLVLDGSKDVYSVAATRSIQIRLYGAETPEGYDQQGFAYPGYLIPILIPFALIDNVEIATAIWQGLTVVLLIGTLALLQDHNERRISMIPIFMLTLWFYPLLMIFQGQFTILALASIGIGYWAYRSGHDIYAGILLSIGWVKPELIILPIVTLMVIGLKKRRFKFVWSVCLSGLLLLLISFALLGWWIGDWIAALQRYTEYAKVLWPIGYVWEINPALGASLIFLIVALYIRVWHDEEALIATSIPIQMILFPQTLIYGLTILCIPLVIAWRRKAKCAVFLAWLLGWVLLTGSFMLDWWKIEFISLSAASLIVLMTMPLHTDDANPAINKMSTLKRTSCCSNRYAIY